jgi:hypothetical protein
MTPDESTELTPEEEAALAALPRQREASRMLEERTVRALRSRGLLRGRPWHGRSWIAAAGVAAAAVVFLCGLVVGQWLGTNTVARSMAEAQAESAMERAVAVQRTGTAYVKALEALVQIADTSANGALAQGREVALTALYAAVHELVLLAPDDPVSVTLRDLLERQRQQPSETDRAYVRNVVWF